ncbi:MAG: zf-HC2 domain-containing protein [Candidatus Sulfotelmatobacter sp.]
MEHSEAIQLMAAEKYLLDELSADVRDEFEEHLFGCHECAMDMRTASVFLEQGKAALAEPEVATARGRDQDKSRPGLFAWLRPAFAIPAMAALLLVIGYQNLVTLPQLTRSLNKPQLLPATTVNLLTYGTNASPLMVHRGEGFLLNVIAPPDRRYPAYQADLRSPEGGVESVAISASADDTWPIRFPGADRQSGTYRIVVHGVTAGGQNVEVGGASFQLHVQQ